MRSALLRKVICLGAELLGYFGVVGGDGAECADELFDFPPIQQALLVDFHPGLLLPFIVGVQPASQLPQMLASVVKVDNLHRLGKVLGDQIPNPFGPVAHHHLLLGTTPAPFPGFPIKASAELLGGFDGAGIGGGIAERGSGSPAYPTSSA